MSTATHTKGSPWHLLLIPVWIVGLVLRLAVFVFDCALGVIASPFIGLLILVRFITRRRAASPSPSASPPGTPGSTPPSAHP